MVTFINLAILVLQKQTIFAIPTLQNLFFLYLHFV